MGRFDRQAALITGAAGNLGRAVAARLAADGASLVLLDRGCARLDALAEDLSGDHLARAVDLLDAEAVQSVVEETIAHFGKIDIVCAIAGGFDMGDPVHKAAPEVWQQMHDLNVGTLLPVLAAVTPSMIARGAGKIVTVGANAALKGMPGMGPYCAAKSTVMRITESAAAELRGHGIRVNVVLPSILDTPENRAAMPDADPANWVSPDSLAGVIAFLASADANAINGALIPVTGLV